MNLHNKAQRYILEQIKNGSWAVGGQIPPELELAETLGISRPTLRQALTQVTNQGYLVRIKGKGTFVTQPKLLHESTSMLHSYGVESAKMGLSPQTEVLGLEVGKPTKTVAERLRLAPSKKVTTLTRLRRLEGFNNGNPVILTTVTVPYDRFPTMSGVDFTQNSFYAEMEKQELYVRHAERELEVAVASEETAKLLQISRFEPVIFITSVGYLENGVPIEYSESWYPGGCSKFQIRVDRG